MQAITTRIPAKTTVLLSGGIDSASAAYLLKGQGYAVRGVFIDYGQAAREPEARAARAVAQALSVDVEIITVKGPSGYGAGELLGRNAFLILTAIFIGQAHRGLLAIGIHAGTPYYDCSPAFIDRMKQLAEEHTGGQLTVSAPFLHWTKPQIYRYFLDAGLPLSATYSCESGTIPPCGSCASCRDRGALGC